MTLAELSLAGIIRLGVRNPVNVSANSRIDTGIIGIGTTFAKGGDADLNTVNVNRTATVTLLSQNTFENQNLHSR